MSEATPDADDSDATTDSTRTRWRFTNDLLAAILVISVPALATLDTVSSTASLGQLPTNLPLTWLLLATIATTWAFGGAAVKAAAKLRSG
jgi:hypothetical protein